ncbi:MAG: hypothetical protein PVI41_11450, partial [Roseobacter sp.]
FYNDIAQIYAYAQHDLSAFVVILIVVAQPILKSDGAINGIDDTVKLDQKTVTHYLENATSMLADDRIKKRISQVCKPFIGIGLIVFHEARVPDHVCGEDRGKAAFSAFVLHSSSYARVGIERAVRLMITCKPASGEFSV